MSLAMSSVYAQDIEVPRMTPAVKWLMGLNVGVFFLQATLVGDDNMMRLFGFAPGNLTGALWTVVTYMFVHGGLMHLALNMYTLWIFGPRTEAAFGTSSFVWYYLWCGLGGWLFHYMFVQSGGVLVGASAAILGVAVAYASRWPDDQMLFFGIIPMNVKWLVLMMAGLNVVNALTSAGGGTAYWAHVGGIVAGWVYLKSPGVQSIEALRRRIAPAPDYGDEPPRVAPKGNARRTNPTSRGEVDEIVAQSKAVTAQVRPAATSKRVVAPAAPPAALDQVLDRISVVGVDGLNDDERRVLDEASRKLREP
jgi:membrane associated rhomboid family serine protease